MKPRLDRFTCSPVSPHVVVFKRTQLSSHKVVQGNGLRERGLSCFSIYTISLFERGLSSFSSPLRL